MNRFIILLVSIFMVSAPLSAASATEVCLPGVNVVGVAQVAPACIEATVIVPPPQTPARTNSVPPPSQVPAAGVPSKPIPTYTKQVRTPEDSRRVDIGRSRDSVKLPPKDALTPADRIAMRRTMLFYILSVLAVMGIYYLIFYRKKNPYLKNLTGPKS